jgi:hypothetical protein
MEMSNIFIIFAALTGLTGVSSFGGFRTAKPPMK